MKMIKRKCSIGDEEFETEHHFLFLCPKHFQEAMENKVKDWPNARYVKWHKDMIAEKVKRGVLPSKKYKWPDFKEYDNVYDPDKKIT